MVRTLDRMGQGARCEVLCLNDGCDDARCLRRMGFREGVHVEVLSSDDPVMLRIDGACLAARRCLLRQVTICPCGCKTQRR